MARTTSSASWRTAEDAVADRRQGAVGLSFARQMADDAYAKRREVWSAFASARGGTLREGEGVLTVGPVIDVPFGDALVRVDVPLMVEAVRVRAPFLLGRGPKFHVEPDPAFAPSADMTFDSAFFVRSLHVHGTRIAWTERAQELLLSFYPHARASSDGSVVFVLVAPGRMTGNALEPACELAAELARYGERFMEPLRAVDGAVWMRPEGPFERRTYPFVRVVRGGAAIDVYPERRKRALAVGARTELVRTIAPFELVLAPDGITTEPPPGLLSPEALELVRAVAPATLASDGAHLRLALEGDADTARLSAAATFLASISGRAKTSVFR
jgi:hypothetical protein